MRKDIIKIFVSVVGVAVFVFLPLAAGAAESVLGMGGDFMVNFAPSDPVPGENVSVRMESYSFDIDRSVITWQVDGKVVEQGMGKKIINLTAPEFGMERTIKISVVTEENASFSKTIQMAGNDIDMLWKAFTSAPSFYKGRSLPVVQSTVEVSAIPHIFSKGKELPVSSLVYEWFVNYKKNINKSGTGKQSFDFNMERFDDYVITLKISSADNNAKYEKSVRFSAWDFNPKIIFYKEDPLEGPNYSRALAGEYKMENSEIGVRAEPYFFSNSGARKINYGWTINGGSVKTESLPNVLFLRTAGGSGSSLVNVSAKNPINIFQAAENFLSVIFGEQND